MTGFLIGAAAGFFGMFIALPIFLGILRFLGLYVIVQERQCLVYVLFGKIIRTIDQPGFYFLPFQLGLNAFLIKWLGRVYTLDLRLDQQYLRSLPVNSEEGAPMGIGIWYEMYVSDPTAFLFRNTDPRGSLRANVSNSAVRSLSNMELESMLVNRHEMSRAVRAEVSPTSHQWGYKLGSVYVRKVHFRDFEMIQQIEKKVVNRLRQVTSAIRQDGANQVNIIRSTAERQAAVELARAAAQRPRIVGEALREISQDPEVANAMFEVLETQRLLAHEKELVFLPKDRPPLLADLLAARSSPA